MTDKEIARLEVREKRYKVYLGDCIFIEVMPSGKKIFRHKKDKVTVTIGDTASTTIKQARLFALSYEDVKEEKKDIIVFGDIIKEWSSNAKWAVKTRDTNMIRIEKYILPVLGKMSVDEIKRLSIIEELRKIETQGRNETAKKVLGLIKQALDYAVICGYVESNQALGLSTVLRKVEVEPMACFTRESDIRRLVQAVNDYPNEIIQGLMFFTMFTLCRPSECRLAKWGEIEGDLWTVPKHRMKSRKDHVVPLSKQCMHIIKRMEDFRNGEFIFPSSRGLKPLSDNALLSALRTMGFDKKDTSVHGFRSMGSTVLNEKGYRHDVIEKALAHAGEDKIRAIYNRAEYLEERRQMLQGYADYLEGLL